MSQKGRKKNTKADDKSKSVYFSWSDDEVQLLLNVAINYVKASKTTVWTTGSCPKSTSFVFGPVDKMQ